MSAGLAGWCALGRCAKCPGADCECECHPGRESAAVPTEAGTGAGAVAVQVRTPLRVLGATASTRAVVTAGVPLVSGRVVDLAGMSAGSSTAQAATLLLSRAELNGSAPKTEFARLLDALGWEPTERLSVDWTPVGGKFRGRICTAETAPEVAAALAPVSDHVWFGTQALREGAEGRGKAADVIGWRSLSADLDYTGEHKAVGVPDEAAARAVTGELAALLGVEPVALVHSGHGLQPHWRVERGSETDWPDAADLRFVEATALSRRFGRLVAQVEAAHGWGGDKVSDLSRVMRVPGTVNRKYEPVEVRTEFTGAGAVSVSAIRSACDRAGIDEVPADRSVVGATVSAATDWPWATADCGWARRMVAGWATDLPRGSRHDWLVYNATRTDCAYRYGCFTEAGYAAAVAALVGRFDALLADPRGARPATDPGEIQRALDAARQRAEGKTAEQVEAELGDLGKHSHEWAARRLRVSLDIGDPFADMGWETEPPSDTGAGAPEAETPGDDGTSGSGPGSPGPGTEAEAEAREYREFWSTAPVLEHLHLFAKARSVQPWAVLGITLANIVAEVGPDLVIPPLVGAPAPLSLYIAVVGPSGAGKGAATGAARDALRIGSNKPEDPFADVYADPKTHPVARHNPGTGEGVFRTFTHRVPKLGADGEPVKPAVTVARQYNRRALFSVPEVSMLGALGKGRPGGTLLPVFTMGWSGEQLGVQNRDQSTVLPVDRMSYTMCAVVGVQPKMAGILLDDADSGTPQRYVWVDALDHNMPTDAPPEPGPFRAWVAPEFAPMTEVRVCPTARSELRAAHVAFNRTDGIAGPLDGHAGQCRLRVAVALALLLRQGDRTVRVTDEDWRLSGVVMAHSTRVRDGAQTTLRSAAADVNVGKGKADAVRAVIVETQVDQARVQKTARWAATWLGKRDDWVTGNVVRKACDSNNRPYLDEALDKAAAAGQIVAEVVEYKGQPGWRYRAVKRS